MRIIGANRRRLLVIDAVIATPALSLLSLAPDFRLAPLPVPRHIDGPLGSNWSLERIPHRSSMPSFRYLALLGTSIVGATAGATEPTRADGVTTQGFPTRSSSNRDPASLVLPKNQDFALWDADKKRIPPTPGLIYRVERADGPRVLLTVPSEGLRGWAWSRSVIPLSQADSYFSYVIQIKPRDPFAFLMRGIVRYQNDDRDRALADLDEALRLDPKYVAAWIERANLWQSRNRLDLALADVNKAIQLDPVNPSGFVARGILFFAAKEFARSLRDLERATSLGSFAVVVYVTRGKIYLERKDAKNAYTAFVRALQIDPRQHEAYLGLASAYLLRGDSEQALSILNQAVESDLKNPDAYGNRAIFFLSRGESAKALENLDEVIRLAPSSAWALQERAWLLATCPDAKLRDGHRAVVSAQRACELTKWKKPRYLATLAAAYSEAGDFDAAVKFQERALAMQAQSDAETTGYRLMLDRYKARKPPHRLGLLEELGIRSPRTASKPGERTPG
jgi:tetratricopeptide (TPR) repeat protein